MQKFLIIILLFSFSFSKTLVVDDSYRMCEHGSRKGWGSYYDYHTISSALNDAKDGDILKICPGTYNEDNLKISQNNFLIESTTNNYEDVNITNTNISSKSNIFLISKNINNFELKGVSLYQTSSDRKGIYSSKTLNNIKFNNIYLNSEGEGIYTASNYVSNILIQQTDIISQKHAVYFRKINKDINFTDINFTSKWATIKTFYTGNINIDTDTKTKNYIKSSGYGLYISEGNISVKNTEFNTSNISIYLMNNFDSVNIISNNIDSNKRGIYAPNELSTTVNIQKNDITLNNDNEGIYLKNVTADDFEITDNTITGGNYGIRISDSLHSGVIKHNIIKNASTYGLNLLSSDESRSFEVKNNCFENGSGKNVISKDTNGVFDSNYYDDWSGSGDYTIPTIPRYDNNPLNECNNLNVDVLVNYRMDECKWNGSNDDVADSSGNHYDATSQNGANTENNSTVDGMIGRVGDFRDGNYAILGDVKVGDSYSMTMWVKFPLDETNHKDFSGRKYFNIADLKGKDNDYIYFREKDSDWSLCIFGDNYECQSFNPQNLSGWHFVTLKISDSDSKFYIDNNLKLTFNQHPNNVDIRLFFNSDYDDNSNADNNPNQQSIGAYVDEFKIYNGLISDSYLTKIYNNELNRRNYDGTTRNDILCTYHQCYVTHFESQDDFDQNWTIIKQENFTPKIVNGKLRLTTNSGNIAAGITLKNKVFKGKGTKFKIKFKHYAYDGDNSKGADGVAVVFSDASITPVAGAFGGSLGYAQRTTPSDEDGFAGGWLGIGLDEYGNYSNPTEGRVGGPGFTEQAVAIRGSYLENYKYLTGTDTLNPHISDGSSSSPSPGYTYEIDVDTMTEDHTIISVLRDTGSGEVTLINRADYSSSNTPDYFKFSFTGSTGGSNNIHEIDDLEIWAIECNKTIVNPPSNNIFKIKEISRNDNNITTKIVDKNFNLEIYSDKNFTGTLCSTVVDSNDNNVSSWFRNYFDSEINSSQTNEGNPSYKVSKALKTAKIKMVWIADNNDSCPLNSETNHSMSEDSFAIRPKNFDIIDYPSTIYAGEDFNITFKALNENGEDTIDYNETNTTFDILYSDIKSGCDTGKFDVNITFNNGTNTTIANYNEIGDVNLTIKDTGFANIDSDDTNLTDRLISPKSIILHSKPYKIDLNTTFSENNITYMDKNLSKNFAKVITNIKVLNKSNELVKNFNSSCYGQDINISYNTIQNTIPESFIGMYLDMNDSNFSRWNNNWKIGADKFINGEANNDVIFNIYKNYSKPISIKDINFTGVNITTSNIAKIENNETLNKKLSFYYARLNSDDIYLTNTLNKTEKITILVYDTNQNHFNQQRLIDWYLNTKYDLDDVKILGVTRDYIYTADNNISDFNATLNKNYFDYNLSVVNDSQNNKFAVIHFDTPYYLWYSKYKDFNESNNSNCTTHYCVEYHYDMVLDSQEGVGSGTFIGSEVNNTHKLKKSKGGVRLYR